MEEKTSIVVSSSLYAGYPASVTAVLKALDALMQNPITLKYMNAYFIPIVNVDAYHEMENAYLLNQSFPIILKNRKRPTCPDASKSGVNLARNFDVNWGKSGSSQDGCDDYYSCLLYTSPSPRDS